MKKIALEEHFLAPGMKEYWETTVADMDRNIYDQVSSRLREASTASRTWACEPPPP